MPAQADVETSTWDKQTKILKWLCQEFDLNRNSRRLFIVFTFSWKYHDMLKMKVKLNTIKTYNPYTKQKNPFKILSKSRHKECSPQQSYEAFQQYAETINEGKVIWKGKAYIWSWAQLFNNSGISYAWKIVVFV